MLLDLRAEHIGHEVCAELTCRIAVMFECVPHAGALGVELEIGFDSYQRREVPDTSKAAAENIETGDLGKVGVNIDEGEVDGNFILRKSGRCCLGCTLCTGLRDRRECE